MRAICCAALILMTGCQRAGLSPAPTSDRATAPVERQGPAAQTPKAQAASSEPAKAGWRPAWWIDKPKRTSAGGVQASGTATAPDLVEARRQAIESARGAALTMADAGQQERIVQAATNQGADGGFTVWVVLEVGGQ